MIARNYSIKKWPTSNERVGSREDVTSSNQDFIQTLTNFSGVPRGLASAGGALNWLKPQPPGTAGID